MAGQPARRFSLFSGQRPGTLASMSGIDPITRQFQQPPDRHGVSAHTPDPTKYHKASSSTGQKLEHGTVIPRAGAGRFGPSLGFSLSPGKVFVDPTNPETGEGGLVIDMSQVTQQAAAMALASAEQSGPPNSEALNLRALEILSAVSMHPSAMSQSVAPVEEPRTNPHYPTAYVVPQAAVGGGQVLPMPKTAAVPSFTEPAPVQVAHIPQFSVAQPSVPQQQIAVAQEPNPWMIVAGLQQQVNDLMLRSQPQQVATLPMPVAIPTAPLSPVYAPLVRGPSAQLRNPAQDEVPPVLGQPAPEPVMTAIPTERSTDELIPKSRALTIIKETLGSLGIPDLGPVATKPKYRVIFDLGMGGKHQCRFHWVGEHQRGLFLIYDTRFNDGVMYSPPDLGQQAIRVQLPDHNQSYTVYSTDFVHPFGVFHIINLIRADTPPPAQAVEALQAFGVDRNGVSKILGNPPDASGSEPNSYE